MINTLHTQLTLDLRAFLNMYADRPAYSPDPSQQRSPASPARARPRNTSNNSSNQKPRTPLLSPPLKNHPGGHIIWQLTELHGNNIEASYTITI